MPHKRADHWEHIDVNDIAGCWNWTAALRAGYGQMWTKRNIHRYFYVDIFGEIPAGLDLDHLCRNRRCCNPWHLEPVTRRENILRGKTIPARNFAKTQCDKWHPLSGENLYTWNDDRGRPHRRCKTCAKATLKASLDRRKGPRRSGPIEAVV